MKTTSTLLVLMILLTTLFTRGQGFSPRAQNRLQTVIDSFQNKSAIPFIGGISAAIKVDGLALWQGVTGYAARNIDAQNNLLAGGTPFTTATLSRIYSVTKTFTAALVLELAKEGAFGLDNPVSMYLPLNLINPGLNSSVTIRQLLAHESGYSDYTDEMNLQIAVAFQPTHVWTPFEMLTFVHQVSQPGAVRRYSSTNYIILGAIIEAVTGKPAEQHGVERSRPVRASRTWAVPSYPHMTAILDPSRLYRKPVTRPRKPSSSTKPVPRTFQIRPVPSWLAVAIRQPSGLYASPSTAPTCPFNRPSCPPPVAASRKTTAPSAPLDAIRVPSGLKAQGGSAVPVVLCVEDRPARVGVPDPQPAGEAAGHAAPVGAEANPTNRPARGREGVPDRPRPRPRSEVAPLSSVVTSFEPSGLNATPSTFRPRVLSVNSWRPVRSSQTTKLPWSEFPAEPARREAGPSGVKASAWTQPVPTSVRTCLPV